MSDGTTITEEHLHEDRHTVETILGGALGGGIIAIAGAILAIIGLAGMEPRGRWALPRSPWGFPSSSKERPLLLG